MKHMRILHIHKFFDQKGGAEQYLHRLIERQADAGHDVHVLATRSSRDLPSPDAKYFIHQYDFSRSEGPATDAKKAIAYLWNQEARRATERVLREVKPDVVHLHNIYHHLSSSILAPIRASGIPCVQTLHDLKLACPNYKMFTEGSACERCKGGKYWNPILHHCLSSSTAGNLLAAVEMTLTKATRAYERTVKKFICPSEFYAVKMREWGEPAAKMVSLPNPAEITAQAAPGGGGFILFAGRLSVEKGLETLIRASAQVPSLPLKIAGTGPEEERVHQLADLLDAKHVSFLGFVPPDELARIRERAEAVVAPSVWYENSPLTVLEAMGQGIPVIGSEIGGIPELVRDGQEGLLAAPGKVTAWIKAFERFQALSSDERQAMGARGRQRVHERHSWDRHLQGLERVYRDAGVSG
jgi:glycosyltransferase involved in cell wall biosynthesis